MKPAATHCTDLQSKLLFSSFQENAVFTMYVYNYFIKLWVSWLKPWCNVHRPIKTAGYHFQRLYKSSKKINQALQKWQKLSVNFVLDQLNLLHHIINSLLTRYNYK